MEAFLAFPAESRALVPPMTHVKGSWIASSVLALRERGHYDAYIAGVDPAFREVLPHPPIGEWLPVEAMMAHYQACDRLQLSEDAILALAAHVSTRAQGGIVDFTARAAAATVVTPWVVMAQFNRLLSRVARGGGLGVFKLGPKDARVDIVEFPGARYRFCGIGMRGVLMGILTPFCRSLVVKELPGHRMSTQIASQVSWA